MPEKNCCMAASESVILANNPNERLNDSVLRKFFNFVLRSVADGTGSSFPSYRCRFGIDRPDRIYGLDSL